MKKLTIGFILGLLVCSGIVYAKNYFSKDIQYKNNKSVEDALDDLYGKIPSGSQNITANGEYDISKKASINVNVPVPSGYYQLDSLTNAAGTGDIVSGKKAYASNGTVITGTYSDRCVSGTGAITSDFTTSTGGKIFDFVPSQFYIVFSGNIIHYYINGSYQNKIWSANQGSSQWGDITPYYTVKNNKYYAVNWSSANVGMTYNYVACK